MKTLVRLQTSEGVWMGILPEARALGVRNSESQDGSVRVVEAFAREMKSLAKKFRNRVRKGVPERGAEADEAVHDLRTATRGLLAHLIALKSLEGKALRHANRQVRKVLDWTGRLRNTAVEEERLKRLRLSAAAIQGFVRILRKGKDRRLARLNQKLAKIHPGEIRKMILRFSE